LVKFVVILTIFRFVILISKVLFILRVRDRDMDTLA